MAATTYPKNGSGANALVVEHFFTKPALTSLEGEMAKKRPDIPKAIETEVLTACRRRCAVCFGLDGDVTEKAGQIAHLDNNPANNAVGNLCFLCLPHHDQYDGTTSQSKNLTLQELKQFRDGLYVALPEILARIDKAKGGSVHVGGHLSAGSGKDGPGGNLRVEGGAGRRGASGGDVHVGPGHYNAGDGGPGGKGGDLTFKGGDAE